jgi:hypothetical protein
LSFPPVRVVEWVVVGVVVDQQASGSEACAMDDGVWIVEQAGQAGDGSEGRRTKSEVRRAWAKLYTVKPAQSEQDRRNGEAADGGR